MESSSLFTILFVTIFPAFIAFLLKLRNERYASSGASAGPQLAAESYARSVMKNDEHLVMVDFPYGGREHIVLTDQRIYYAKKDETVLEAAYSDVEKLRFENLSGSKVSANGSVDVIIIKTAQQKIKLYTYVHAAQVAQELERRVCC